MSVYRRKLDAQYRWAVEAYTPDGWKTIYSAANRTSAIADARKWIAEMGQSVRIVSGPGNRGLRFPKPRAGSAYIAHGDAFNDPHPEWSKSTYARGLTSAPHGRERYIGIVFIGSKPHDVWVAYEGRHKDPSAGGWDDVLIAQAPRSRR